MDPFTKLIDYFIKLIELKNSRKDKYYSEVVKGCYENAQHVRNDFLKIFHDSEELIRGGNSIGFVADKVLESRMNTLAKRDFLRAVLNALNEQEFTDFEKGIGLLLSGDLHHALKNNASSLHRINNSIMENKGYKNPENKKYIANALEINNRSISYVNSAWEMINTGYSEHLKKYLTT